MDDHGFRPEVENLAVTETGRRRRWTDAEKVRIFGESFGRRGLIAKRRVGMTKVLGGGLPPWRY